MDSNKLNPRPIDAIGAAKTGGELTREQLVTRLKGAIVKEEEKPSDQRSLEQVLLYERILYELETGKPYESRKEEQLQKALTHLATKDRKKARLRPVRRIAAVLAAVVVLVGGIELLLHREWLYGKPSDDGQQYIIQGASSDPGLVAEGKAIESESYKEIRTENFEEVIPILGYRPTPPATVPVGWHVRSYFASNTPVAKRFTASYQNDDEEYLLKYEERTYASAERVRAELEQNELGASIDINGVTVYSIRNTGIPICVWINGLTYHSLYGPVTNAEIIETIKTIGG